jgi:hypothetical protein
MYGMWLSHMGTIHGVVHGHGHYIVHGADLMKYFWGKEFGKMATGQCTHDPSMII